MLRRSLLYSTLVALIAAVGFALARPALSAPAAVRIMPLGDSITAGPGCWRAPLWNRLQTTGFTNIDFVGSVADGGCSVPYAYDGDNEGHGGIAAIGMADQNQLPPWLAAAKPDIVLMHLGTNDIWGNPATTAVLAAYTTLVGQMRASNPNMKILVAQIIPMSPSNCTTCAAGVVALDNAIPGWAAGLSTSQSPIVVVDQWTGFDPVADTNGDGVHPNDSGFAKMADRWYPPLARALGGTPASPTPASPTPASPTPASPTPASPTPASPTPASPTPASPTPASPTPASPTPASPTPTSPTPASPTPTSPTPASPSPSTSPGGAGCAAAYKVVSQWTGGFQGEVTVTNGSAAASSAWTATVTFADGQQITQSWNAAVSQSGPTATAHNMSYNGSLAAGGSTTFGFLASSGAANSTPSVGCRLS